jgi:NAD(P)H-hydrate epimerase
MERAGRALAEDAVRLTLDRPGPILIACGPGNNGGDGFVIARHLDNAGWPISVQVFARHNRDRTGDAEINFDILFTSGIHFTQYRPDHFEQQHHDHFLRQFADGGWVVDALFGTGLSKPLAQPHDWLVGAVNDSGSPVLAVDIPSGLDCDTGEPLGACVKAAHTATFVAPKRGFLNPASKQWAGEVHVIDIGAPRVLVDEYRQRGG